MVKLDYHNFLNETQTFAQQAIKEQKENNHYNLKLTDHKSNIAK